MESCTKYKSDRDRRITDVQSALGCDQCGQLSSSMSCVDCQWRIQIGALGAWDPTLKIWTCVLAVYVCNAVLVFYRSLVTSYIMAGHELGPLFRESLDPALMAAVCTHTK